MLLPLVINGLVHENQNVNAFDDVCTDMFNFTSFAPREKQPLSTMPIKRVSMDNKLLFDRASAVILKGQKRLRFRVIHLIEFIQSNNFHIYSIF